jgi:branched-chain amino acid transport system permease protein
MKGVQRMIIIGLTLFLASLPVIHSTYWTTLFFTLLINISLTGGINLLWGFAGYMNLGFMSFFGLGAYGTAILMLAGWPFPISLLVCLVLLAIGGGFFGFLLFRLQGLYFSVVTLGVLILLEESAGKLSFLSGGPEGLSLPLGDYTVECYWLSLALAFFSLGVNFLVNRIRLGYRLRMIREDEPMAQSVGVPVLSSKIIVYVLGASIALLAGGITVHQSGYIGPSSAFGLSVAMPPVIMTLIGGKRWWNPLAGAVILTGLQEVLWTGLDCWVLSGYGVVLILLGIFYQSEKIAWASSWKGSRISKFF